MLLRAFCHLTEQFDLLVTMTKNYTQLSLIKRYQIEALVEAGMKQKNSYHPLNVNLASTLHINKGLSKYKKTRQIY